MRYEIEQSVIHDELGEGIVKDDSYIAIGDIEVQEILFESIPEGFTTPYGYGIDYNNGQYTITVSVMDLVEK